MVRRPTCTGFRINDLPLPRSTELVLILMVGWTNLDKDSCPADSPTRAGATCNRYCELYLSFARFYLQPATEVDSAGLIDAPDLIQYLSCDKAGLERTRQSTIMLPLAGKPMSLASQRAARRAGGGGWHISRCRPEVFTTKVTPAVRV